MISVQTNLSSLLAQENLRVNNEFQSKTIQRLTSGYRINQSGDDAAGLAVANGYRSSVTELTQGVRNANDGVSTLQIIDGGLSNITKMLDRAKTLGHGIGLRHVHRRPRHAGRRIPGPVGRNQPPGGQHRTGRHRQLTNANASASTSVAAPAPLCPWIWLRTVDKATLGLTGNLA